MLTPLHQALGIMLQRLSTRLTAVSRIADTPSHRHGAPAGKLPPLMRLGCLLVLTHRGASSAVEMSAL